MKQAIVITSIFAPTEAVRRFGALADWGLFVAGDKKSPAQWASPGATYLGVAEQEAIDCRMVKHLPYNHYGRKMMAYLKAMEAGAEVIAESDDDNIPYDGWSFPAFEGSYAATGDDLGFVNMYRQYTPQHIWPRGYPLDRILDATFDMTGDRAEKPARIGVWQGLADGDPDVDAIYRLTNNTPCTFDKKPPLVLGEGTWCPFNSQNTAFVRELFPLLYLPSYVTFRFTDILRGLVAQPVLQAAGYRLGFTEATVVQERNPHDYMKDFISEIPCFLNPYKVIDEARAALKPGASVGENLMATYEKLVAAGIVPPEELPLLQAWLADVKDRSPA